MRGGQGSNYILYSEKKDFEFANYSDCEQFQWDENVMLLSLLNLNNYQKEYIKSFLVKMQSYTRVWTYEHITGSIPATNLHTDLFLPNVLGEDQR